MSTVYFPNFDVKLYTSFLLYSSPKRIYYDSWMSISEMDNFQLGRIFKANRLYQIKYKSLPPLFVDFAII